MKQINKSTSKPQAQYHSKTLTDYEYNELIKQKEILERPERAKQKQRNYEDGQLMKYGFYFGLVVGAFLMFWLLQLLKWAGIVS